jgi:hypothetical protein
MEVIQKIVNNQKVLALNYEETMKSLDQEIRKLKGELGDLERARRLVKKKNTDTQVIW